MYNWYRILVSGVQKNDLTFILNFFEDENMSVFFFKIKFIVVTLVNKIMF